MLVLFSVLIRLDALRAVAWPLNRLLRHDIYFNELLTIIKF